MDSNHRYRIKNNPFWLPALGPAIRLSHEKPALSCRDRWFESISLQRGVRANLDILCRPGVSVMAEEVISGR